MSGASQEGETTVFPDAGALDMPALERFLVLAMVELTTAEATLNSLNVFPVPDGDTGSNLRATWAALFEGEAGGEPEATDEAALRAGLRRLTMSARGNAGVILSEYVRGAAEVLRFDDGTLRPPDVDAVVRMLHGGAHAARRAVDRAVEGTVLSVADAAAAGAAAARSQTTRRGGRATPGQVLERAVEDAMEALRRSPQQLAALEGVVDAGGAGLLLLLEAFARVAGGRHGLPRSTVRSWLTVGPGRGFADEKVCQVQAGGPAYELMGVVDGLDPEGATALRSALGECGDSVVVAGGDGVHRVHVHTDDVIGAASRIREHGAFRLPSVTRFAGGIGPLATVAVDLSDPVLDAYAQALGCGVARERGPRAGAVDEPALVITDGVGMPSTAEHTVLTDSAVHAVAALEACAAEALVDAETDLAEVARDAVYLTIVQGDSWRAAHELVRSRLSGSEQIVALVDPAADHREVARFHDLLHATCADVVVLRVSSGVLVQMGAE